MKIGDKVVWNKHICGEFSNAFNLNGKTGTILRIYDGGFADVYFFDRGVQTVFKEDLQLVEINKTNNMNNLKELEKKYAELGKEIQALKENKIQYPIYFEVKYPIYCKGKYTGLIVKFDSLKSGIVVKQTKGAWDFGHKGTWAEHTNTDVWEQLEVDEETGFYDTQPVWCLDNDYTHSRMLKFYDSKNKCAFKFNGKRDGHSYDNYLPFEGNWHDWMIEAHKTLEK